jgi:hypothetical protein
LENPRCSAPGKEVTKVLKNSWKKEKGKAPCIILVFWVALAIDMGKALSFF